MEPCILNISNRGQITIPLSLRKSLNVKYVICKLKDDKLILEPLKTKDDFIAELEAEEKDWEEKGGIPWHTVMKKAGLKK